MKVDMKYWRSSIVLVIVALALLASPTMAFARNPNPGVLPPNSRPFGLTYGQWSAEWWKYAVSVTTFEDCPSEPSGRVWFLAGATGMGGTVTRSCTVPHGRAILFPIINAECSTLEGNGTTETELRDCAKDTTDLVTTVEADVDGVSLRDLNPSNTPYRVQSPLFGLTAVPGNIVGVPAGTGSSVADGYWIMLAPLPTGRHTVHFRGEAHSFNFNFITDATYNLIVG